MATSNYFTEEDVENAKTQMRESEAAWDAHSTTIVAHPHYDPVQTPNSEVDYKQWLTDIENNWNMIRLRGDTLQSYGHLYNVDVTIFWGKAMGHLLLNLNREELTWQNCLEIESAAEALETVTFTLAAAEASVCTTFRARREFIRAVESELRDNGALTASAQRLFLWKNVFSLKQDMAHYSFADRVVVRQREEETLEALSKRERYLWGEDSSRSNAWVSPYLEVDPANEERMRKAEDSMLHQRKIFAAYVLRMVKSMGGRRLKDIVAAMLKNHFGRDIVGIS